MKIVVFNCDRYADVSAAWYELYRTMWPEQPYEVAYVTNSIEIDVPVPVYYIERPELDFGGRVRAFLHHHYTDDLLLLTMADYLLKGRVDHETVRRAEELCTAPLIRHCRLRPMPRPQRPFKAEGFGRIKKGTRYSLSLQPGIWESQVLYDLVQPGENPWHIETRGSGRTRGIRGSFLSTETHVLPHHNYYRKGKPQALDWVAANVPEACWPDAVRRNERRKRRDT